MTKSNRLIFFGNERLATAVKPGKSVLAKLIGAGYEIAAAVSHYHEARSRKQHELEIATIAKAHNIPLLLPEKLADIKQQLADLQAEAAILIAYGQIIPAGIIDLFPKGIINLHPSLLPQYRGPTPIESAILDGAETTGVSLMKLAPKMDAGPVYAQQSLKLDGVETKQELADQLLESGGDLLLECLPAILDGTLEPQTQDDSQASYTQLLAKKDGVMDFAEPAEQLEREVRAYLGWPGSHTEAFGQQIIVTHARTVDKNNPESLVFDCQPGYLEALEIRAPSGRLMSGSDFIRGYKK